MNMRYWILFFGLLISFVGYSQNDSLISFIPKDYDILYGGIAKGDLNKDSMEDIVFALYNKMGKESIDSINIDSIPPRLLIVLFGTETGYTKVAETANAILCKNCGGIFGDPFAGISINKNILEIYHYGGSNWKWSYTHKFRFQNGQFYLIGQATSSFWSIKHCDKLNEMAGLDYEDINFITGQFERKRISKDCKLLENKKGKREVKPLISLTEFTIED
jgi:hypothetical protein